MPAQFPDVAAPGPAPDASTARSQLRDLYSRLDVAAAQAHSSGLPVVGVLGNTVPVELIRAAGGFPLTLTGRAGPTPEGDRWMEPFFEPEVRAVFDGLLTGRFGPLALCVIPRTSDQYFKLFLYLTEVQRIGHGAQVPPLHLYDLLHTRTQRSRSYGIERTRELLARLAQCAGRPITDDDLGQAIVESNRRHVARGALLARRGNSPALESGTDALMLLGAGRFMLPDHYSARLLDALADGGRECPGPRLLVRGFPLNHTGLHAAVEAAGGVVVAEDDPWGSRSTGHPIDQDGDALLAIFDKYFRDEPSARVHPDSLRRQWYTQRLATGDIDGVIVYAPDFDDLAGWDVPGDLAVARELGVPATVLRGDAERITDKGSSQIAVFVQGLGHD
ncbi:MULTISPECIES: 2-hydroxyacyl-CoA dehydratase [unclassified Luteimonas]